MSVQNGAPGATVSVSDASQAITGAPVGIGAFLGIAERGPLTVSRVNSFTEYLRTFGTYLSGSWLAYCAERALNAGSALWIQRVVHLDDSGDPTCVAATATLQTAGGGASAAAVTGSVAGVLWQGALSWPFNNNDTLSIKVDGAAASVATITGTPATKTSAAHATFNVQATDWIEFRTGPSYAPGPKRKVTFTGATSGLATSAQLVAAINAQLPGVEAVDNGNNTFSLTTDLKGTAARLEFVDDSGAGAVLAALGFAAEVRVGGGAVSDLDHVALAEINTLVAAATTNAVTVTANAGNFPVFTRAVPGSPHSIQFVNGGSPDADAIAALGIPDTAAHAGTSNAPVNTVVLTAGQQGVEDPGAWANNVTVDTAAATVDDANKWKLTIKRAGTIVETQDELSMDPTSDRYFVKVLQGSQYVVATDEGAFNTVGTYAAARPAVAQGTALTGGSDGGSVVDADYEGDATDKTGFYAFDGIREIEMMACPGVTSRPLALALVDYCAARGTIEAVLDVPFGLTPGQVVDWRKGTGSYAGQVVFDSRFGAAYENWPQITDSRTKLPVYLPPAGDVFGAYANSKIRGASTAWGVTAGPDGGVLDGATGVAASRSETDIGQITSAGVNCIINSGDYGVVIWGERNLQLEASDFDRVPSARGVNYLARTLRVPVERLAVFQPNDSVTQKRVKARIDDFLDREVDVGGLVAWLVQNDASVNTAAALSAHTMNNIVFIKINLHAEFIPLVLMPVNQAASL